MDTSTPPSAPIAPIDFFDAGFALDASRASVTTADIDALRAPLDAAHMAMQAIESGAIHNQDEQRQVTHFTDRQSYRDSAEFNTVENFFAGIRNGDIIGSTGERFDYVVINGIGGSALGPQLLHNALRGPYWNEQSRQQRNGNARIYFTDNTDPSGIQDLLHVVSLANTLIVTISKSGSTREPRNNMVRFEQAYAAAGLDFSKHAAAVTMPGSELDRYALENKWLGRWPMAESIGGRTSVTAVVGHVPAAAAGIDFNAFLDGACTMDEWTRDANTRRNPAYVLAAVWYVAGNGTGERNLAIVPYADRLVLLGRYLQQLVMESLGKEYDRDGNTVHQGLTVYGNKGGTDAHAYIQQLNDGRDDFVVTFIEVLNDIESTEISDRLSMGDYLHNFMQGLSNALHARKRRVVHITLHSLDERALGMLIALNERAVAVYAELININAFHQPGVQAYKLASATLDQLMRNIADFIAKNPGFSGSAGDVHAALQVDDVSITDVTGILAKLTVNDRTFGRNRLTRECVDHDWVYCVRTG